MQSLIRYWYGDCLTSLEFAKSGIFGKALVKTSGASNLQKIQLYYCSSFMIEAANSNGLVIKRTVVQDFF